jgi:hypothetical protein
VTTEYEPTRRSGDSGATLSILENPRRSVTLGKRRILHTGYEQLHDTPE